MDDTRVYISGGSADRASSRQVNYHSHLHCTGLSGAASIKPQALKALKGAVRCSLCWTELRGWDLVAHDVERDGDSSFEAEFVRQVLSRVRKLEPHDVRPQKTVKLEDGTTLRIDFVLQREGRSPLAVELDGYDKTGRIEDAPSVARADKAKRRQLEQQLHYEVVEFSNKDLSDPHVAIRDIEARIEGTPPNTASAPPPSGIPAEARLVDKHRDRRGGPRRALLAALLLLGVVAAGWFVVEAMDKETTSYTPASDGSCPNEAKVKGNVSMSGERIFHETGWRFYDATIAEECFASAEDAEEAGYRASQAQ